MSNKYSKNQQLLYQYSERLDLKGSLNSDSLSDSPPKDNPAILEDQGTSFEYERQKQEGDNEEIDEIKQEENEAEHNFEELTKPVKYCSGDNSEKKYDYQREKVLRELLHERELNRNQRIIIQQKEQIISAFQEERRLYENEHKLRNDGLQEQKRKFEAEKEKLAHQSAKIERERQEKRQELQWRKSNRNTLSIIVTQYGQALSDALQRYSQVFDKDERDRIFSQLKQHSPSIDQNNLQADLVNLYLAQSLECFINIAIKRHQERQNYYNFRMSEMQEQHEKVLGKQSQEHLIKLDQLGSQLQQKQQNLEQKIAVIESLTKKLDEYEFNNLTNLESSRQQTQKHLDKIGLLTTTLEKEKSDSLKKIDQLSSKSERKYLQLVQKAKEEVRIISERFSASKISLEQDIKQLNLQKLDTEKVIDQLTSSLAGKDEQIKVLLANVQSLQLESQKLQAFKRQNKKMQTNYRELQTELKQDFSKQLQKMKIQHKIIKDNNQENLDNLRFKLQNQHKNQQQVVELQIKKLKDEISLWKDKEQNHLLDYQNLRSSNLEKQRERDAYKVEFQLKTVEVIQSIVRDESAQSQTNRQIFLQTTKDLQDKLAQQCKDKQILCKNYCQLEEKYNELSKDHFLLSIKLQETTQSLLQVQLKEQICMKEITQLRDVLSKIQQMHKNVVEEMQNNFDSKLSTTIGETSQFYQVILDSKEKIYEKDLQKLQQELQSLRLIKNIKEKISADNEIKLENQRQDLKMKIKTMQRQHDSAIKNNKNEITNLTESNQFLKKSLDLSSEFLSTKQRVIQSLQNERTIFRKTINFIHNQLEEKNLEQVLDDLDRSNDEYNQEVIDMVNGIYFSVSGVSVQNKRLEQENLQITQEKQKLDYILKEFKANVEDKDKKLEKVEKTATQMSKLQEKIKSLETELKLAKNRGDQYLKSLANAQEIAKKNEQQMQSIRNNETQTRKDIQNLKSKLVEATRAKNAIQKALQEKETQLNGQIIELNQKIDSLRREKNLSNKQTENSMKREIEQLKSKLQAQNIKLTGLQAQIRKLNNSNQILLDEKSNLKKTIAYIQQEKNQLVEANNVLKNRQQEPVRRLVQSPSSKDSQKLIQYEKKANELEKQNKRLESDLSKVKDELVQSKKNAKKLSDEITQLKRELDDVPRHQDRRNSWNEQEDLVRGYQQIASNLREENALLEKDIESLKEKLKKSQANNQRSIRSYVSPTRENGLSDKKSPSKMSQIMEEGNEKMIEEFKKNLLFSANCIMERDHQGSSFIVNKIEEIFGNKKKIESTQMLFKFSQTVKIFSFSNFLPKELLQTECFFIIFTTKSTKFAILSYKLQISSRQLAVLFSITNKKAINKRSNESGMYQAVAVEAGGDFVVGGGHIRMRPSSKVLAIKDGYRYFETYDKKEVYGSEYWRQQVSVQVNEFEIHRVYLK